MSDNNLNKPLVSIVVSAYNEEGSLLHLYDELKRNLDQITPRVRYEIIIVNDGSRDNTLNIAIDLTVKDRLVKIVNFERNFGHEIAMTAGLDYAKGDAIIFMDADLQHPPKHILEMVEIWLSGSEIVLTKCVKNEQKTWLRTILVDSYYKILNLLSDVEIPRATPDFRLISGRYITVLRQMKERERMFRGLLNWLGCKNNVSVIEFEAPKRFAGVTNYNFSASLKLAFDSIIQFSIKPLKFATFFGICSGLFFLLLLFYIAMNAFIFNNFTPDYQINLAIVSFFSAFQMLFIGILGEYVGRIHMEVQGRPLYFAKFIDLEDEKR